MEEQLPDDGGCDVAAMRVKTEAADEHTSAPVSGSRDPPAPCGDTACGGRGGGGVEQSAEVLAETELQAVTATPPVLLYPVSTDQFFTASGDGKTFLKIAPASVMAPASSEKMLPSGTDFSSKAVLCLIEAVGRRWGLYETRERSQLFQSVQEEMASKGHVLPVEKIRRKWNNLIVTYKRVKDRSRETGHAKTSWEFFDLMDATLCDTVGSQISSNKRTKSSGAGSSQPLAKIPVKVQPPQPTTVIRPNGDFGVAAEFEPAGQVSASGLIISGTSAMSSIPTGSVSPTNSPELKPLIVLNSDLVPTSMHPATIVPSPTFISSPCFTEAASPSLGSTSSTDLNTSLFLNRKTPAFSSGVIPFRLSGNPNPLSLPSSSFPSSSSCLPSSIFTSMSTPAASGTEAQGQKGNEEQSSATLIQEILKRQETQSHLDRASRHRLSAREKRRERREVRMAESLVRIATALELLSSKQDTVIALLQRLADRK